MDLLRHVSILLLASLTFCSCQKSDFDDNPQSTDSIQDGSSGGDDFGMLYFLNGSYGNDLVQFDLNTEKEVRRYSTYVSDFGLRPFFGQELYDSGKIYFSSVYSVTCMDANTGNAIWKQNLMTGAFQRSLASANNYPVIVDTIVYTISYGGTGQSLNALNKHTGKILWRANIARNMAMAGRYYGTPMVYKDKIYTLCPMEGNDRQNISCYNRFTGELIWERIDFPHNIEGYQIIANNSTLVVFSVGNSFAAGYNLETGDQEFFTKFDSPLPFGASVHVVRGKIYGQAKYHILKIDLDAKKVTTHYDGEFNGYIINDDFYVRIGSKIIRKDIETFQIKWSWETPLKDTMQSVYKMTLNKQPDGYYYNIFNYPFIVTDKYVFWINAATRDHEGMKVSQVFNSLFIINKETGKLIKEVKFPANGFDNIMNPGSIYFSIPAARPSQYYP